MGWLTASSGTTLSGWDIYKIQKDAGDSIWAVGNMFGPGKFFLTGLTVLVAGLIALVVAPATLALPGRPGRKYLISPGVAVPVTVLAILVMLVVFIQWFTWLQFGRHVQADLAAGMYVLLVGGLATMMGLLFAVQRRKALLKG
jgi:hypothetical protein